MSQRFTFRLFSGQVDIFDSRTLKNYRIHDGQDMSKLVELMNEMQDEISSLSGLVFELELGEDL